MPAASNNNKTDVDRHSEFLIVGGGMGGLVLALGLKKLCHIQAEVLDQAPGFGEGVGGAIGMYPNGLKVIQDISPKLLETIQEYAYPYVNRRWYRHDGTEIACAKESLLTHSQQDDDPLQPIGIRRWKLQKALYDACVEEGIPVHFHHAVKEVTVSETSGDDTPHSLSFWNQDYKWTAKYVFGADGVKSRVREAVLGKDSAEVTPAYTGVTCLMGASSVPRPNRGICFPSSATTKCHMCTYPTAEDESIFQIYFPTPVENPEEWGGLTPEQERIECGNLADRLKNDGWDDQFVEPLRKATPGSVVRVGLRSRPPVSTWHKQCGTLILLGDAAHPPVPYIGQGAMMAIEDAGSLCRLIQKVCCSPVSSELDTTKWAKAVELYEDLRLPRTSKILASSHELGKTQQRRADSWLYNLYREASIAIQVKLYGTLPIMIPGATFDYETAVDELLKANKTI